MPYPESPCTLEVCLWDALAYQEHIHKVAGVDADGDGGVRASLTASQGPDAATMASSRFSWQDGGAGGGRGAGAGAALVETLVDDVILKQVAVERLCRRGDTAEAQAEVVGWRFRDAEARVKQLALDNQQLRWVQGCVGA